MFGRCPSSGLSVLLINDPQGCFKWKETLLLGAFWQQVKLFSFIFFYSSVAAAVRMMMMQVTLSSAGLMHSVDLSCKSVNLLQSLAEL